MYERFYHLRERPFALSPDPDYLYPSRVHQEALDYLRYSLGYRGPDDDFGKSTLAGLYCRFGPQWNDDLVAAVRREVTTYNGFLLGGTENHIAMRRTAGSASCPSRSLPPFPPRRPMARNTRCRS